MGYAVHFKDGDRCNEVHPKIGKSCFLPNFHVSVHVAWDDVKAVTWDKVIPPQQKITMQDMLNGRY